MSLKLKLHVNHFQMYGRLHSPTFTHIKTHYKAQTTLAVTTPNIFSQWVKGIRILRSQPSVLVTRIYCSWLHIKSTFTSAHFQLSTKSRLYFQVIDCHPYENLKKVQVKYFFNIFIEHLHQRKCYMSHMLNTYCFQNKPTELNLTLVLIYMKSHNATSQTSYCNYKA